ncbi:MAG: nuclear transport factor 2 family protein [Candidatus Omnitrophica bacterium]|nr:nuclear transport factor 2 family protein [Candidatus Omnitrophota bacterium]
MSSKLASWVPENWSKTEREVWDALETHWDHLINKRVDEFIKFIHPDMTGYGHESPIPVDRPWLEKWVGFWTKSTQIAICELRPIQIKLHGDIAILQYLIFTVEVNAEGGKRVIRRYTMTWKKTPERWVVIASHNNLMNEAIKS